MPTSSTSESKAGKLSGAELIKSLLEALEMAETALEHGEKFIDGWVADYRKDEIVKEMQASLEQARTLISQARNG